MASNSVANQGENTGLCWT